MELLRGLDEILKVKPFKVLMEGNTCILEEPALRDYPSTRIKIKNHREALAYRFDFNRSELDMFPYLNEKVEGLYRMCDYIIFYQRKGKLYVFLCELKSKNVKGSAMQVQASEVFANFIIRMAKRHLDDFKEFDTRYRALIFSGSNTRRFSTNVRNDPYSQYKNGLKFKHLKCGEDCSLHVHCDE
jgi:hypothetical protein